MRAHQTRAAVSGGSSAFYLAANKSPFRIERRKHKRVPRSFGILVQPMDNHHDLLEDSFFAITRDLSPGGLAYLSSHVADFEIAVISLEEDISRSVVARVSNSSLIHASEVEQVYLTGVEFLYETFV